MKKIFLTVLLGLCSATTFVYADNVITNEDFEKYSLTEKYNTETLAVSYEGMANITLTKKDLIVNAPGGIFTGAESYEGNAAKNIIAYAKTGEGTAIAVGGDLNNGWMGWYSHPMRTLDSGGGATAEMNVWNRRLSVVSDGGQKALKFSPAKDPTVNTHSIYSYESIDFSAPVQWESDIKVETLGAKPFVLSLTNGANPQIAMFTHYYDRGRTAENIKDIIEFTPDKCPPEDPDDPEYYKIRILGEESGKYQKGIYYTVSVFIDASSLPAKMKVEVKQKDTGSVAAQTELTALDPEAIKFRDPADITSQAITGVEYAAFARTSDANHPEVYVDNINIYKVTYEPTISSNTNIAIDGAGYVTLIFPSKYNADTVNESTVTVKKGKTPVAVTQLSKIMSNKRIKIYLPELDAASKYTISIDGVANLEGIVCRWTGEFETEDIVSVSDVSRTAGGVSYKITNNANKEVAVTVLAAMYKNNKIVTDGVCYKKVSLTPLEENKDEGFTAMASDADKVVLYALDSIGGFKVLTPPSEN